MTNLLRIFSRAVCGGILLAVWPLAAADITAVIVNTDNKAFEGVVCWKTTAKVYVITTKNQMEFEIAPDKVKEMRVAEPAGLREAIKAVQEGKVQKAIPVLDNIAQEYFMLLPWDERATRWLAEAHVKNGSPLDAVKACERIIDARSAAATGELCLAYWQALLAAGRNAKLTDQLDAAAKSTSPTVQARVYIMRGDILEKRNNLKDALREGYLRAVVLCPGARAARAEAIQRAAACFDKAGQGPHASRLRSAAAQAPAGGGGDEEGKAESEVDREVRYADGLVNLGLPDYSEVVQNELLKKHPEAKAALFRVKIDALASQGGAKLEQAEAEIAKVPSNSVEAASATLAVADRYYQFNKLAKARQLYERVLEAYGTKGPPPEMEKFYAESAYRFSQMLSIRGDHAGAVKALKYVLLTHPDKYMTRLIKTEIAELQLKVAAAQTKADARKATLTEAMKLCEDVMWTHDDLYGRSVVTYANCYKLLGNSPEARKLIGSRMGELKEIEDAMKEADPSLRNSPMGQCKFLLGTLHEDEARAVSGQPGKDAEALSQFEKALGQYFTVVVRYPSSAWAPEACQRIDGVIATLKQQGHKVDLPGIDMGPVMASRYKEAHALFQDNNYTEAAARYLQALNLSPAFSNSVYAVGELAQCFMQDQNERYARATISYLAERFSRDDALATAAGNALLMTASAYLEAGQGPRSRELYILFADKFPNHERTPSVLLNLGDRALRVTNYVDAAVMYQRVVAQYNKPGQIYNDALNRLAVCQAGLNDHSNAIQTLKLYYGVLPNGAEKVSALTRIADALRQLGNWEIAGAAFGKVVEALNQPNNPYSPTADDAKRNQGSKERALFWQGFCFARLKQPAERLPEFQARAVESYNQFLKEFPKSEFCPRVLASLGTLLSLQKKPEEAKVMLDRLVKEYSTSDEAKNVQFVMGEMLLELGMPIEAGQAYAKMLDNPRAYSAAQFLRVGDKMLAARQYATAQKAFDIARSNSDPAAGKAVWEPASLGLGQALLNQSQFAAAILPLSELLKNKRTAYLVPANVALSRSCAAAAATEQNPEKKKDLYKIAIQAQSDARRYMTDRNDAIEADMDLAAIRLAMGEKGKALAIYQKVFDAGNPAEPRSAACMENAFLRMVPPLLEAQRFADARDAIESYEKQFPRGKSIVDARTWKAQLPKETTGTQP